MNQVLEKWFLLRLVVGILTLDHGGKCKKFDTASVDIGVFGAYIDLFTVLHWGEEIMAD